MATAKATLLAISEATGAVVRINPPEISLSSSKTQHYLVNLISGDNAFNVTDAQMMVIVPPTGNTAVLKTKGAAGDTGVTIHSTRWSALSFGSSFTSIIINANAIVTNLEVWLL